MSKRRYRFYKNQPVKKMRWGLLNGKFGLILTFLSPVSGRPGKQIVVTQADWDTYGEWRDVPDTRATAIRETLR